ncbi:hypothetical protein NQZ68_034016 [Dissostichus eleginoides]|nr:hypothetical protein NQZ68_034016 [Dissostichus eleginoides]
MCVSAPRCLTPPGAGNHDKLNERETKQKQSGSEIHSFWGGGFGAGGEQRGRALLSERGWSSSGGVRQHLRNFCLK